jgi:hypothetical protein
MKELIIFAAGIVMGAWLMDEYQDDSLSEDETNSEKDLETT